MATQEEIDEALSKLTAEHAEVMESMGDMWVAVEAVRAAVPTDNLHDLLLEVEKTAKAVRDGGIIGSGSNDHRRALKKYNDLVAEQ